MIDTMSIPIAIAALALLRSRISGATNVRELLASLSDEERSSPDVRILLDRAGVSRPEVSGSLASSERDIEQGLAKNIIPVTFGSSGYPSSLSHISDAPPIIFLRGNVSALQKIGVAVVGTRNATKHGLTIAYRIAALLSENGWPVISGLALGIDAAAHEGALMGKAPTVAVLAHGLERASPRANEPLAMRILEQNGLWISEHPYGATARPEYFVQRNRIQVGLSAASVIVEGALKSGSMTQAEYCLRYGRKLFAVLPERGSTVSTQSSLPLMLVRDRGAHPIQSRDDYPFLLDAANKGAQILARAE